MQDARLAHFFQFLPFHAEGTSLHTEGFRRLLQFEEGCSLVSASRQPLHGSSREVLAILPADDAEAGGTTIGTVVLFIEMVFGHDFGVILGSTTINTILSPLSVFSQSTKYLSSKIALGTKAAPLRIFKSFSG